MNCGTRSHNCADFACAECTRGSAEKFHFVLIQQMANWGESFDFGNLPSELFSSPLTKESDLGLGADSEDFFSWNALKQSESWGRGVLNEGGGCDQSGESSLTNSSDSSGARWVDLPCHPSFKVVLVGDDRVGKTALIKRHLTVQFGDKHHGRVVADRDLI